MYYAIENYTTGLFWSDTEFGWVSIDDPEMRPTIFKGSYEAVRSYLSRYLDGVHNVVPFDAQ